MPDKTKAKVSTAAFQYDGFFGDPILGPGLQPLYPILYDALKPWNIRPRDVKIKNPTAANDAIVSYEMAFGRLVLNVSHAGFTLTVQNADWGQAELVTQLVEACWKSVTKALEIKAKHHELQIAMTLVPEGKTLKDITQPFSVPWRLRPADELDMCGLILYTKHGSIVVDKAAANPQAIFVKVVHRFGENATFAEMLKALYEDEGWLGNAMELEIE
jgi:hypothetical protein